MPSVASAHPLWSVTLRALRTMTRLAATALVLVVGLGGLTAGTATEPATTAAQLRPLAVTSRVDELRPDAAASAAARSIDADTTEPGPAEATPVTADVVATARLAGPATDPGRGMPARRGPPTA
ncbi:hypothetical protein Q3W71_07260 [Micromonospora sp. C28SCA-DRY-2]|uniref:hypothetical protein n=1 Tax=Micromonospora sp. C28SCA-DRY-2 TaxID=3059522 RepID=UPI00267594BD|nr:hypothetical protein [Micromonospora sp. C28SCA-DRY-2]MDO3701478.1 hypothetical protein [Micromonospora sp. C28SCA-DRY-2]